MDDEAFAAYVISNAPRYEIETLEKIVQSLNDNIASRRCGKPQDLQIGSHIEATVFGTSYSRYGTVVRMSPSACTIEAIDSEYTSRISYKRHAIRVLSEFEWNRVIANAARWREEYDKEKAREVEEAAAERATAVRDRAKAKRNAARMEALNGTFEIYCGCFVHAYRPDWGHHEYGVVVSMSPKKIYLTNEENDFGSNVWVAKHEIEILSERQWEVVELEQRRRRAEFEAAKKAGREQDVPDYSAVAIPLPPTPTS
jgi:hypothetical protein